MRYGTIIVAAGLSSRMGAFKPMLPLGEKTVIRHLAELYGTVSEEVVVITGHRGSKLAAHLHGTGVRVVHNPDYGKSEMFDSICLGIRALYGRCQRFYVTPADIPLVSPETLRVLRDAAAPIVRPVYCEKSGHPLVLSSACMLPLLLDSGENGLRGAIARLPFQMEDIETMDPGILMDADTPKDYQRLCAYLDFISGLGDGASEDRVSAALRGEGRNYAV